MFELALTANWDICFDWYSGIQYWNMVWIATSLHISIKKAE